MPSESTGRVAPSTGESGPKRASPGSAEAVAGKHERHNSARTVQRRTVVTQWSIQDSNLGPLPYQGRLGVERRDVRGHAEHKIPALKRKWLIDRRRRLTPGLILMYPSGTSLAGVACGISGDVTKRSLRRPSGGGSMLAPRRWISSGASIRRVNWATFA